jgi:hypothetical protein
VWSKVRTHSTSESWADTRPTAPSSIARAMPLGFARRSRTGGDRLVEAAGCRYLSLSELCRNGRHEGTAVTAAGIMCVRCRPPTPKRGWRKGSARGPVSGSRSDLRHAARRRVINTTKPANVEEPSFSSPPPLRRRRRPVSRWLSASASISPRLPSFLASRDYGCRHWLWIGG